MTGTDTPAQRVQAFLDAWDRTPIAPNVGFYNTGVYYPLRRSDLRALLAARASLLSEAEFLRVAQFELHGAAEADSAVAEFVAGYQTAAGRSPEAALPSKSPVHLEVGAELPSGAEADPLAKYRMSAEPSALGYTLHVLLDVTPDGVTDEATMEVPTWDAALDELRKLPQDTTPPWRVVSIFRTEDQPRFMLGAERIGDGA